MKCEMLLKVFFFFQIVAVKNYTSDIKLSQQLMSTSIFVIKSGFYLGEGFSKHFAF